MDMLLAQDQSFSLKTGLTGLMKYMWHEVLYNGRILVTIVLLSIFSMILETLQTAFERNQVSKVAYSICYLVILVLAINSFHVAITYASNAIGGMIDFMMAMVPLLFTLLASMGGAVTVTVTHPLVVFMVHAVGTAVHTIVFPLLFFSALLHIVSSLSDKYKLTQLADLLRSISMALLGVLLTVFLGVISVKGIAGSVTDGVTLRAAKYLTGNFVPVVGKVFADATDTVISASLLVKTRSGSSASSFCCFSALSRRSNHHAGADLQPFGSGDAAAWRFADRHLPGNDRQEHAVCFAALAASG
ncbi:hypothetical protein HMSSN036_86410 [Paenibacillus macerans]|nr:hypothetical protein HMSSN036_86410 [Paenibacillus macerans]